MDEGDQAAGTRDDLRCLTRPRLLTLRYQAYKAYRLVALAYGLATWFFAIHATGLVVRVWPEQFLVNDQIVSVATFGCGLVVYLVAMPIAGRYIETYRRRLFTRLNMDALLRAAIDGEAVEEAVKQTQGFILCRIDPGGMRHPEQRLEVAACFHLALDRWLGGQRQIPRHLLTEGCIAWHAGRPRSRDCSCIAAYFIPLLGLPLAFFGARAYLRSAGALIALCDQLLKDEALLPLQFDTRPIEGLKGHAFQQMRAVIDGWTIVALAVFGALALYLVVLNPAVSSWVIASDPSGLVFPLGLGVGGMVASLVAFNLLFSAWVRRRFRRVVQATRRDIEKRGLLALATDDSVTRHLLEQSKAKAGPGLFQVPVPRTIDQQLVFAASYYRAYREMLSGSAEVSAAALRHGALVWRFRRQAAAPDLTYCGVLVALCDALLEK